MMDRPKSLKGCRMIQIIYNFLLDSSMNLNNSAMGSRQKKLMFYGQAVRKGGRSAPPALTVSNCEKFDPFFSMEYDTQNTFYLIVRGFVTEEQRQ